MVTSFTEVVLLQLTGQMLAYVRPMGETAGSLD